MASPTLDSFCCAIRNDSLEPAKQLAPYFRSSTYTTVCLVFAIFGVLGASYQILHNHVILERSSQRRPTFILRGRRILQWLGFADLMAALGVILRCVAWLMDDALIRKMGIDEFSSDFCIVSSAITQFFYTATYMWTLLYAVDVLRTLKGTNGSMVTYGLWAWLVPLVLSVIGFLLLFVPDTNCHARGTNSFLRHFPNYVCVYVPLVSVLVACPLLVRFSLARIRARIVNTSNRFSNRERRTLLYLRFKFVCIIIAFYLCWVPNLVNGIILWSTWPNIPVKPVVVIWYFMAVVNPSQAVLNSVLYRSWDPSSPSIRDWLAERLAAVTWWRSTRNGRPEMDPLFEGPSKSYDSFDDR
ncbi:uncharacterized protein LOC119112420 isoform X1 [Pollicipes pollicipes]|nr:uncharacterized protein LOC119112420 isoform X1 [Pollicipes pollicipes]XP_037092501.1 uncharacterized protein LOC119112420 isoform X1 [Pollicipes pollicipes]XP_037092502.1 uncharacterized protein LOC119112420 isoform X1 [Pollicipes pollicipes]XP_037092503.1 uncharacterized protein LOC119112420 isoform X1 [Pollicipes pollicipes]